MVINISPETEKQLTEIAKRFGTPLPDYAGNLLETKLREETVKAKANGHSPEDENDPDRDPDALTKAIAELQSRTPEEREQARERLLQASRPPLIPKLSEEQARKWGKGQDDDDGAAPDALARAKLLSRTPEEIEQTRQRFFQEMETPRPLPEGKTLFDVICGKWPGDETDEEVFEALRKLS